MQRRSRRYKFIEDDCSVSGSGHSDDEDDDDSGTDDSIVKPTEEGESQSQERSQSAIGSSYTLFYYNSYVINF